MPLKHHMPGNRINHRLLLAQPQLSPQLVPQRLDAAVDLLHPREAQAAPALAQQVDGQLIARRARDEVGEVGGAVLGRERGYRGAG